MNLNHLLLMLHDGAGKAEEVGEPGIAAVLNEMSTSMVTSMRHENDFRPWRKDDLYAIYHPDEQG